jgi:hypothetical protein
MHSMHKYTFYTASLTGCQEKTRPSGDASVSRSQAWERGHPGRIRCGLEARAPEDRTRN